MPVDCTRHSHCTDRRPKDIYLAADEILGAIFHRRISNDRLKLWEASYVDRRTWSAVRRGTPGAKKATTMAISSKPRGEV
jgi:hypothetical protein